jgi:hypothetical protein
MPATLLRQAALRRRPEQGKNPKTDFRRLSAAGFVYFQKYRENARIRAS